MARTKEMLRHIPELDGVRGIAVLIVMIRHFYNPVSPYLPFGAFDKVLVQGVAGVDLFFVLSGFLITSILISTKDAQNYFKAFYARRALRIMPLYMLMLILFFWIAVPFLHHHGKELSIKPTEQLYYWFFLANWPQALHPDNNGAQLGHFWSLGVEEQFYICWSLVVWFASKPSVKNISIVVIVASIVCHITFIYLGYSVAFLDRSTITRIDGLALGSLLAVSPEVCTFAAKYARIAIPFATLAAVFMVWRKFDFIAYDIGATSLVALALTGNIPILKIGWLRSFGKYSFGLYVIHYIINSFEYPFVKNLTHPLLFSLISIPTGIALSYSAAWISWNALEAPFLSLKGKFNYHFSTPHQEFPAAAETA
jgi:peptidoglycan/LPS O-acetylase OafA/YrhL